MEMGRGIGVAALLLCGLTGRGWSAHAVTPAGIVVPLADRLIDAQIQTGPSRGLWPDAAEFTGTIVCGLVGAYEMTCDPRYLGAAESGARFFISAANGNFYGDEAHALMCLDKATTSDAADVYASALRVFYDNVRRLAAGGTAGYLSEYARIEISTAVFYLANHVVAAYHVDAQDRETWRLGLIEYLSRVDDSSADYPVVALGIATWALAMTAPADDRPIVASSQASSYWLNKTLHDLPQMLMSHQVGDEGLLPGTFYWRFDHGNAGLGGPKSGYTEDLVYASLGLAAARRARTEPDMHRLDEAIRKSRHVLMTSLHEYDEAPEHLWLPSGTLCLYSGEALQCLAAVALQADMNLDGRVDAADFSLLANPWRTSECLDSCSCDRGDFNRDGGIGWQDLALMAEDWLDSQP